MSGGHDICPPGVYLIEIQFIFIDSERYASSGSVMLVTLASSLALNTVIVPGVGLGWLLKEEFDTILVRW